MNQNAELSKHYRGKPCRLYSLDWKNFLYLSFFKFLPFSAQISFICPNLLFVYCRCKTNKKHIFFARRSNRAVLENSAINTCECAAAVPSPRYELFQSSSGVTAIATLASSKRRAKKHKNFFSFSPNV